MNKLGFLLVSVLQFALLVAQGVAYYYLDLAIHAVIEARPSTTVLDRLHAGMRLVETSLGIQIG